MCFLPSCCSWVFSQKRRRNCPPHSEGKNLKLKRQLSFWLILPSQPLSGWSPLGTSSLSGFFTLPLFFPLVLSIMMIKYISVSIYTYMSYIYIYIRYQKERKKTKNRRQRNRRKGKTAALDRVASCSQSPRMWVCWDCSCYSCFTEKYSWDTVSHREYCGGQPRPFHPVSSKPYIFKYLLWVLSEEGKRSAWVDWRLSAASSHSQSSLPSRQNSSPDFCVYGAHTWFCINKLYI